ncbi:helix-turn-helix transcriptional regulator [Hymenobacter lutimineralis]|uniref:Helix-turn-helix transcriptional regulator n=1 Tax=Hymenobacter lutimineralis TaxID=2606448 RepID=A0A5D6UTG1_9BACT|nr:helix-turn-helix transcriptional regulator [Hymenobacter lutimineralis]TYZ06380.1 helix-turn-helix transcriptional regulator [Hymenobacter lutimineralis]
MPRRARVSLNVLARVRAWFGLRQDQLALFLGVSPSLVQGIESGRRRLTEEVALALLPLLQRVPPDYNAPLEAAAPALALPPDAPGPEAAELDFRRRTCLQQAAGLRQEADKLAAQARATARWAQALPALLTTYPAPAPDDSAETAQRRIWLRGWLPRQARPLPPATSTRWHLLQARITALEAEAAALAALLEPQQPK